MARDETEWTPTEREALDRLPREEDPGPLVEERTVRALRARGLLGRHRSATPSPGAGSRGRVAPAWWAAGIAAALALFFAGLAVGQGGQAVTADDLIRALHSAEAADRPSLVQHTGSLYVDAVASLASAREQGDESAVGTGVEVGMSALYAAALELARLHPEDPRLREVLRALEQREATPTTSPDVHWF